MGRASDGEDFTGNLDYTPICFFGGLRFIFIFFFFFAFFNVSFVFGWKTWLGRASDGKDFTGNLYYTLICFFGMLHLNFSQSLMSFLSSYEVKTFHLTVHLNDILLYIRCVTLSLL